MRVVIADDSLLVREGIARLLATAHIDVCDKAPDAKQLLASVEATRPDIAIVDIKMPPTHTNEGLAAAATIRARYPEIAVLVLSQYIDADYALTLVNGSDGRCGYLLKDRITQPNQLVEALHRLGRGETVVDRALVDELLARDRPGNPLDELTAREHTVLSLMAEGLTDRGIAERLWVSPKTVETHVRHILAKLAVPAGHIQNRRVQAVLTYLNA